MLATRHLLKSSSSSSSSPPSRLLSTFISKTITDLKQKAKTTLIQSAVTSLNSTTDFRPPTTTSASNTLYQPHPSTIRFQSLHINSEFDSTLQTPSTSPSASTTINDDEDKHYTPLEKPPTPHLIINDPLTDWQLNSRPVTDKKTFYNTFIPPSSSSNTDTDPFNLVLNDINNLSNDITRTLNNSNNVHLSRAASYFFEDSNNSGKRIRPTLIMLLGRCLEKEKELHTGINIGSSTSESSTNPVLSRIYTLAQITEMIHTASLYHDDVIDGSPLRRNLPTSHNKFNSNKLAILAGDYLLSKASVGLARLGYMSSYSGTTGEVFNSNTGGVVEIMSVCVENLVKGEVMQMATTSITDDDETGNVDDGSEEYFPPNPYSKIKEETLPYLTHYLLKSHYKTGSLLSNSLLSTTILSLAAPSSPSSSPSSSAFTEDQKTTLHESTYKYGKHLGLSYQLIDDILDFTSTTQALGKNSYADLLSGVITAPVIYAAEEFPELYPMINRGFAEEGDVERGIELVLKSNGIKRTEELARVNVEHGVKCLVEGLPSNGVGNEYAQGLVRLGGVVLDRLR